jgi:lipopolysaccharide biosynthesis glycosyltransferase
VNLNKDKKMEVLCACDERYLPHAATMLCSLLEHNSVFRVHYFYSSITSRNLAKLKSFVVNFGSKLACYEVVEGDFKELRADRWISIAAYYRLLAERLLPSSLDKVLYLDSDLIVRRSLKELWNTDLADCALAAVNDYWEEPEERGLPEGAKYFNSGVLLINLKFWRQNRVFEQATEFVRANPEKVRFWDQDALNMILANQWIELETCWNAQHDEHWHSATQSGTNPAIVHFISESKPWQWSNKHPFKHEYHKYRLRTPWGWYRQDGQPTFAGKSL